MSTPFLTDRMDLGSKIKDYFSCKRFQKIQTYDFTSYLKRSLDGE